MCRRERRSVEDVELLKKFVGDCRVSILLCRARRCAFLRKPFSRGLWHSWVCTKSGVERYREV